MTKGQCECSDLDRVTDYCPCAVRFDIGDIVGTDAGNLQSLTDDLGLPFDAGRQVSHFARSIVVDCRPENQRVDMVAVCEGILDASQCHNSQTTSKHGAAGSRIERSTVAVPGENLSFTIGVAMSMRDLDRDSASQSHVAFMIEQTLTGHVNRNE